MPPHGRRERGCLPGICSHRVADAFCFVPGINPSRVRWRRRMIPSLLYSLFCSASGHRKRPCSKPKCAAVSILFLPVQVAKFDDRAAAVHVSQGSFDWRCRGPPNRLRQSRCRATSAQNDVDIFLRIQVETRFHLETVLMRVTRLNQTHQPSLKSIQ